MQTAFVLNLKEGQTEKPLNVLGMPTYLKVSAKDTNGQFSLYYGEYKKKQGPPLHQHDLDEFFYVTEGEFLFQLGDKKVKAIAGSTIFIPRMMPHTFLVISEVGKTLFMLSPSGKVEQLFEKFDSYVTLPPVEELVGVMAEHGSPVLGPQITED